MRCTIGTGLGFLLAAVHSRRKVVSLYERTFRLCHVKWLVRMDDPPHTSIASAFSILRADDPVVTTCMIIATAKTK